MNLAMKMNEQTESRAFLLGKALDYLNTYINKFNGEVVPRAMYGIVASILGKDNILAAMRRIMSTDQLYMPWRNLKVDWEEHVRQDDIMVGEILEGYWYCKQTHHVIRQVVEELIALARRRIESEEQGRDIFAERFRELVAVFRLSEVEQAVLLLAHILSEEILAPGHRWVQQKYKTQTYKFAPWLQYSTAELRNVLMPNQKLRRYQLLNKEFDFNDDLCLYLYGWNKEPLEQSFFVQMRGDVLPWKYFGALAEEHGALLEEMIRNRPPQRGLHILLYGVPGSGKTSFAQALAKQLGLSCYAIAQDVQNDNTARTCSTPEYRFGALRLCSERVDPDRSIMIVDEADDMLRGHSSGGGLFSLLGSGGVTMGDKGLLNNLLDEVKTPCIWISNTSAEELDPSSRRRFDYSIRFKPLTFGQRLAIWRNNVEKHELKRLFSENMLEKLAGRYEVSAGGIALVLRNVADLKPKARECEKLVEKLMAPHCELMAIRADESKLLPAVDYSLEGLNIRGDMPLERVVEAIRRFQHEAEAGALRSVDWPRMNLLLSGPPGTGKTEFVKYLGSELKTKVVVRMGSDILSSWVGGTEQNIRRAFEAAEEEKAILFFDEINGLLQDRGMAQRSWEVTQVNELLCRMENFNGVLIGATNFTDTLDPAVARRFTFKLEFQYLDEAGKRMFFERMFMTKLAPQEAARLAGIPDLAPGDFRTVRQGQYYLGREVTNMDRLVALERESQAKGHSRYATKKIGF